MAEYLRNLILNADSYKASHYLQYPPGATRVSSYIESRGGKWDRAVFFGLQMALIEYLSKPIAKKDIDEAEEFWTEHGLPFNRSGWERILKKHKGFLPLRIEAVAEGSVVPNHNVLLQAVNTDPECCWLTSYVETILMRAVWYPTTVCTNGFFCKESILSSLRRTSDDADAVVGFKLHDFGFRGASSLESAAIGDCAHLVNFQGTDTVAGVLAAREYYGEKMAGYSIPAAEHSTMTAWGEGEGELAAFSNMLDRFAKQGKTLAVVSDSFDIYNACSALWGGKLRERIEKSGATVVVRPDSGIPEEVVPKVVEILMEKFGVAVNSKGFKVLPDCIRVIQGDGINYESIKRILFAMEKRKLSTENVAFGMGGGLLQDFNRDTLQFAMKASAMEIGGKWRDVSKSPVDDAGKHSKKGRLALVRDGKGNYFTIRKEELKPEQENLLKTVFENGKVTKEYPFAEIRKRAAEGLEEMLSSRK
ncbi:MAG: nicotinate phosphoribosyltransferase [Candidatus Micrarchaeia archaeon]